MMEHDAGASELLEREEMDLEEERAAEPIFSAYVPRKVRLGRHHPEAIVESAAMACIEPPDPTYEPKLPPSLLRGTACRPNPSLGLDGHAENALSAAQLETVCYAGQRHEQMNGDGTRCGFFLGDGTGVGKGRQIAAVIVDNICHGRYRHIWCSISTALFYDARRDLDDLGRKNVPLHALHKLNYGEQFDDGRVIFEP